MPCICDITTLHPNTSSCIVVVAWKVIQKPTASFHVSAYGVVQKEYQYYNTNDSWEWMILAPEEALTKFHSPMPYDSCISNNV